MDLFICHVYACIFVQVKPVMICHHDLLGERSAPSGKTVGLTERVPKGLPVSLFRLILYTAVPSMPARQAKSDPTTACCLMWRFGEASSSAPPFHMLKTPAESLPSVCVWFELYKCLHRCVVYYS